MTVDVNLNTWHPSSVRVLTNLVKKLLQLRLLMGALLLVGLLGLLFLTPLYKFISLNYLTSWVEHSRSNSWNALIFYLLFVMGVLIFPITPFPIVGGVLLNFWIALPLNILAASVGAWLAFLVARFFGRDAIEPFLKGHLKSLDRYASAKGFKTVLFLRWVGIPPFTIMNYALGLSGVKGKDYLLATLLGILPWMCIVTYASSSLWKAIVEGGQQGLTKALWNFFGPLMILSLIMIGSVLLASYIKRRKEVLV